MAFANASQERTEDPGSLRDEWLKRLSDLRSLVKSWAEALDWSTRQFDKTMKDSRLGRYEAPALLMQKETTRVLLDPVARFAPGTDGVVDLYLMPAYDDVASLYFVNGQWQLHYVSPNSADAATMKVATEPSLLSKEMFQKVLNEMSTHAASTL